MSVEIIIEDRQAEVLSYQSPQTQTEGVLNHFFEFWPSPRMFDNPDLLRHCSFFDLHISRYVRDWVAGVKPPPDPGFFEDLFPIILSRIAGPDSRLTLCVQSSDPDYFDGVNVIKDTLAPKRVTLYSPADTWGPKNAIEGRIFVL